MVSVTALLQCMAFAPGYAGARRRACGGAIRQQQAILRDVVVRQDGGLHACAASRTADQIWGRLLAGAGACIRLAASSASTVVRGVWHRRRQVLIGPRGASLSFQQRLQR